MKLPIVKIAALLSALLLLPATSVLGQTDAQPQAATQSDAPSSPPPGGFHRGGGIEHRVEMLQRSLNLTTDQTTQVKTVLEAERTRMEAMRSNSSLAESDRHSQMMAIHGDTSSRIRALLTSDQATKYDSLEARMGQHRPGNGEAPPPLPRSPDQQ